MPPQKNKDLTDDEKFQAQIAQENEVHRLHRKYTLLDRDRNIFFGGGDRQSMKQNRVFTIYSREHNNIETDLAVANAPAKKREDSKIAEQLTEILEEYDQLTHEVNTKKIWIQELCDQIRDTKKMHHELQKKQITDSQYSDRVWKAFKTLEALENKLEVQMGKFGSICTTNIQLRLQISYLLAERATFMKIWNKMLDKLTMGKKYMLDLIEQATIAYDQREEWLSKLNALRLKTQQDYFFLTQQMRTFNQKKDHSEKMQDFFSLKTQKRNMQDLERKMMLKRRDYQDSLRQTIKEYKDMMNEIHEFTNESQVGIIAKKFYIAEQENFSRFNYINSLMSEMEILGEHLSHCHVEIESSRNLHQQRVEQQQSKLVEWEHQLEELELAEHGLEDNLKEANAKLAVLMDGVGHLFKLLKCSSDPLIKLLGEQTEIRWYNVEFYLRLVEKKVHEVVLKWCYKDKRVSGIKEDRKKPIVEPLENLADTNPCPLCFEHDMVAEEIDTVQRVLTREEAKVLLKEKLKDPDAMGRVHNVSKCHLPRSREIMQKRYQV